MTPAYLRSLYSRFLGNKFEIIKIRRYSGTGQSRVPTDYGNISARVEDYEPTELIGGVVQGDVKLTVLAADVDSSGLPLPIVATADKVVVRGREMTIKAVNNNTRRTTELYAYEIRAGG